ncbi:Uncharacterised protein [Mycobacteroides abscessus subsp. abscessus]|nr:Uncharacterised protein [Mycobacteroides abscessus subsp. abscessus]
MATRKPVGQVTVSIWTMPAMVTMVSISRGLRRRHNRLTIMVWPVT